MLLHKPKSAESPVVHAWFLCQQQVVTAGRARSSLLSGFRSNLDLPSRFPPCNLFRSYNHASDRSHTGSQLLTCSCLRSPSSGHPLVLAVCVSAHRFVRGT